MGSALAVDQPRFVQLSYFAPSGFVKRDKHELTEQAQLDKEAFAVGAHLPNTKAAVAAA